MQPPYFVFLDNFSGHMGLDIAAFCKENGIHLLGLHPNATFIMQPLDVGFFKGFKSKWNQKLLGSGDKPPTQVKRTNVCSLIGSLFAEYAVTDFSKNVKSAFGSCGLFPLNRQAIDSTKFVKHNTTSTAAGSSDQETGKRFTKTNSKILNFNIFLFYF